MKPLALYLFLGISTTLLAENWPRFRGPNGSGLSETPGIPAQWSQDDHAWSVRLPGQGHASPVVWGQRLFVTSADQQDGQQTLMCLDTRSGKRTPPVSERVDLDLGQRNLDAAAGCLQQIGLVVDQQDRSQRRAVQGFHDPNITSFRFADPRSVCAGVRSQLDLRPSFSAPQNRKRDGGDVSIRQLGDPDGQDAESKHWAECERDREEQTPL